MASQKHKQNPYHFAGLKLEKFQLPKWTLTVIYLCIALGIGGFLWGLQKDPQRTWASYLTAFFFVSSLSLGALFFTAIQHIAKAGWSVTIRRSMEGMSAFVPWIFLGALALLPGLKYLYIWADPVKVAEESILQLKAAYLNGPFFVIRLLIFGFGISVFHRIIIGNSIKQDHSGEIKYTLKNVGWSVGFILFFAITYSLFSVDLLMSLLPTWYSTIFGVYTFAGLFQSSLAFLILLLIYIKRKKMAQGYITIEHIHDVAKYLKGFTVFWAYIAFSQFMLIWYANIPEETEFFIMRAQNGWMSISLALLIFKFIVPFIALLPRSWKRDENHLILVSLLVLTMQYIDIFWLVYPNFNHNHLTFGFYEFSLLVGFMGLFLWVMNFFMSRNPIVPVQDPRLHESLDHHVLY